MLPQGSRRLPRASRRRRRPRGKRRHRPRGTKTWLTNVPSPTATSPTPSSVTNTTIAAKAPSPRSCAPTAWSSTTSALTRRSATCPSTSTARSDRSSVSSLAPRYSSSSQGVVIAYRWCCFRDAATKSALPQEARLLRPRGGQRLWQVLLLRWRKVQHDHLSRRACVQREDRHLHLARRSQEEGLLFTRYYHKRTEFRWSSHRSFGYRTTTQILRDLSVSLLFSYDT